ncbi:MAG TPA: hypothetical protein VGD88_01520 [Opitutaceae bacterium]
MALPSRALVHVLRETADRLASSTDYQWSHFGRCNCGHLAQTVTRLSPADIHAACARELTEWSEIPDDYCAGTGLRLEYVLDRLRELGLDRTDLRHLEDLSDPRVLHALPGGHRWLQRNQHADAVLYLRTWAGVIEASLPSEPVATHDPEVDRVAPERALAIR